MEEIINKYDYVNCTETDEEKLQSELYEKEDSFIENMDLTNMKNVSASITRKICVKDFPNAYTPSCNMALNTFKSMGRVMQICIEDGKLEKTECQEILFELYQDCLQCGPGSSHIEILNTIHNMVDLDMGPFFQELQAKRLLTLANILKAFKHIPEEGGMVVKERADQWSECTCELLSNMSGSDISKKRLEPEVQNVMVDLYLFYFQQIDVLHRGYALGLERCMRSIANAYVTHNHKNPYLGIGEVNIIKDHLLAVAKIVTGESFPKYESQLDVGAEMIEQLFKAIQNDDSILQQLWEDVHQFIGSLIVGDDSIHLEKIILKLKSFYFSMKEKTLQDNPKLLKSWSTHMTGLLEDGDTDVIALFIPSSVSHFSAISHPQKGDIKIWMPLLKGLLRHENEEAVTVVYYILSDERHQWEWKKYWEEGKSLLSSLSQIIVLDVPNIIIQGYGNIVQTILLQFEIANMTHRITGDVIDFCISVMEERKETINDIALDIMDKVPLFERNKEGIPDLLKRFETLLTDEDYPWMLPNTDKAGGRFLDIILNSYTQGSDMAEDVNKSMVKIFTYCVEGNVQYSGLETGDRNIFYNILLNQLPTFVQLHIQSESHSVLTLLVPVLLKLHANDEEEDLKFKSNEILISIARSAAAFILSDEIKSFVDWYTSSNDVYALNVLCAMFAGLKREELSCDFQEIFASCLEDSYNMNIQLSLFFEAAKKTPEIFTQGNIVNLLTVYFKEPSLRKMVLEVLDAIVVEYPNIFPAELTVQKVFHEVKVEPDCYHYVSRIVTSIALSQEVYADKIFEETLILSKKNTDPELGIYLIELLFKISEKFGFEKLLPHKAHFQRFVDRGATEEIKQAAQYIIDKLNNQERSETRTNSVAMVGKSPTNVSLDLERTGTPASTVTMEEKSATNASLHLDPTKENVNEDTFITTSDQSTTDGPKMNEKVKVVVNDEEETKVITGETLNEPLWSSDVAKLLNPETEHDWRQLAGRLGYTNNNIKEWASQSDPCMSLLKEWFSTHSTAEATEGILNVLQGMNRPDAEEILENAMKLVEDKEATFEDNNLPQHIFLSYHWSQQSKVIFLRNHLRMAGFECLMDIGQMGYGNNLSKNIDNGIRNAKVFICCISRKYVMSPSCNTEVNIAVNLLKPIIPLMFEDMEWPLKGNMGSVLSYCLNLQFFKRRGGEKGDERFWSAPNFQELLMLLSLDVPRNIETVKEEYKEWWKALQSVSSPNKKGKGRKSRPDLRKLSNVEQIDSDIFLSYQWDDLQKIKELRNRLTELGFSCWMDIYQMDNKDTLAEMISAGVKGCKIVLSCITAKYLLSMKCRKELGFADTLQTPILPLMIEKLDWPPNGPMSLVFSRLQFIDFMKNQKEVIWKGKPFEELTDQINEYVIKSDPLPSNGMNDETSSTRTDSIINSSSARDLKSVRSDILTPSPSNKSILRVNGTVERLKSERSLSSKSEALSQKKETLMPTKHFENIVQNSQVTIRIENDVSQSVLGSNDAISRTDSQVIEPQLERVETSNTGDNISRRASQQQDVDLQNQSSFPVIKHFPRRKSLSRQSSIPSNLFPQYSSMGDSLSLQTSIPGDPVLRQNILPGDPILRQNILQGDPVSRQNTLPGDPVSRQHTLPGDSVSRQNTLRGDPVSRQHTLPGDSVSRQNTLPGDPVSRQHTLPGDSVSRQNTLPGDPVSRQHTLPGDSVSRQNTLPGDPVSRQHTLPGDSVSRQNTLPGDPVSRQHTLPGDPVSRQHTLPGDSVSRQNTLPGDPVSRQNTLPGDSVSRQSLIPEDPISRLSSNQENPVSRLSSHSGDPVSQPSSSQADPVPQRSPKKSSACILL